MNSILDNRSLVKRIRDIEKKIDEVYPGKSTVLFVVPGEKFKSFKHMKKELRMNPKYANVRTVIINDVDLVRKKEAQAQKEMQEKEVIQDAGDLQQIQTQE